LAVLIQSRLPRLFLSAVAATDCDKTSNIECQCTISLAQSHPKSQRIS
jgi:hypothetical protein